MLLESAGRPPIHLTPGVAKTIGRADDADVVVDEPSLSRLHARVRMTSTGDVTVEDLDSTNGVFVNGIRRAIATVTPGDTVRLGVVEYHAASSEGSAADALISTSLEMMAFGDLQALLERVLDRVRAILAPDRSAILLFDRVTGTLRPRCVRPSGAYDTVSQFASSTAVRQSLASRDVLVVDDAGADARLRDAVSVLAASVRSTVCVPLLGRAGPIGALYADRTERQRPFTPEQIRYAAAFAAHAAAALETAQLYDDREQHFRLTLEALAKAIDARDRYTAGHSERVTSYALELARATGLPDADLEVVRRAGMLHDIGKVGVPDRVLLKSGPLDAGERALIEPHTIIGYEMLRDLPFLREALPAIRGHHERWDGGGYPDGLSRDGIHP
ncbi:MAG TPA: HD domain-containing phosphohydrolase, partial [Vicinamibacterales bacterium]|nr:HD domain-containing phosphohydrolase [Vicinamibacterales bacterium]